MVHFFRNNYYWLTPIAVRTPHHIAFCCNGLTNSMALCAMQRLPTLNGLYLFVHTPYRRQICALPKKKTKIIKIEKKQIFKSVWGRVACIGLAFDNHVVETELIRLYLLVCVVRVLRRRKARAHLPTCTSPLWLNYGSRQFACCVWILHCIVPSIVACSVYRVPCFICCDRL